MRNKYIQHGEYTEIIITKKDGQQYSVKIDTEDAERCAERKWHINLQGSKIPYPRTTIDGKSVSMHHFILQYEGSLPVDHIDRNSLNNTKKNLRIVNTVQNVGNNGALTTYLNSNNEWIVSFTRYYKKYTLGPFKTQEEALIAKQQKIHEIEESITDNQIIENKLELENKLKTININKQQSRIQIPIHEKYIISLEEACLYFSLTLEELTTILEKYNTQHLSIKISNKTMIKRIAFENFLNRMTKV